MSPLLDSRGCPSPSLYRLALPTAFSHFRQIVFAPSQLHFVFCDAGKKREFCKGGVWQGEGGRQAGAQPRTPLLSTSSAGPHLAAGHQHPERQVHAAGTKCCLPAGHPAGTGGWLWRKQAASLSPFANLSLGLSGFYYGDV